MGKTSIIPVFIFLFACAGCGEKAGKTEKSKIFSPGKDTTGIREIETEKNSPDQHEEQVLTSSEESMKKAIPHEGIMYFESTSSNADKATPLYEYLKFTFEGDKVYGVGFGDYMQGSDPWSVTFKGRFISENKIKITLNYSETQEYSEAFSSTETWEFDYVAPLFRIYRKGWRKLDFNMGAAEYHEQDVADIPEYYLKPLKKLEEQ